MKTRLSTNGASLMTDTAAPVALTLSSRVERMFPTLTPVQIIAAYGRPRSRWNCILLRPTFGEIETDD